MAKLFERVVSVTPRSNNCIVLRDCNGNYIRNTDPLSAIHGMIASCYVSGRFIVANTDKGKTAIYQMTDGMVLLKTIR